MKKPIELEEIKQKRRDAIVTGSPLWEAIIKDLREGMSRTRIANKHEVSLSVVDKIAFTAGLRREFYEPGMTSDQTKINAPITYNKERRVKLIDELFDRAEELLDDVANPADLDKLISGITKLIDKRRLEDGEATSRTESASTIARESLEAKLDELAVRQEKKREFATREAEESEAKANEIKDKSKAAS